MTHDEVLALLLVFGIVIAISFVFIAWELHWWPKLKIMADKVFANTPEGRAAKSIFKEPPVLMALLLTPTILAFICMGIAAFIERLCGAQRGLGWLDWSVFSIAFILVFQSFLKSTVVNERHKDAMQARIKEIEKGLQ